MIEQAPFRGQVPYGPVVPLAPHVVVHYRCLGTFRYIAPSRVVAVAPLSTVQQVTLYPPAPETFADPECACVAGGSEGLTCQYRFAFWSASDGSIETDKPLALKFGPETIAATAWYRCEAWPVESQPASIRVRAFHLDGTPLDTSPVQATSPPVTPDGDHYPAGPVVFFAHHRLDDLYFRAWAVLDGGKAEGQAASFGPGKGGHAYAFYGPPRPTDLEVPELVDPWWELRRGVAAQLSGLNTRYANDQVDLREQLTRLVAELRRLKPR